VQQIGLHDASRLLDAATMPRQQQSVLALQQQLQGGEVVRHPAFRRRHHSRVPAHDVIAREDNAASIKCQAQVVRGVTRGVQGGELPIFACHDIGMPQVNVGRKTVANVFRLGVSPAADRDL
jgi:hypothetical protein